MKVLYIFTVLFICTVPLLASPVPQFEIDSELVNSTLTESTIRRQIDGVDDGQGAFPVYFGSVIGEIVVGSGTVDVQRSQPKKKTPSSNEGPSFSKFISGPGVDNFPSSGSVASDSIKPPREIAGATLVFNNEAHVAELS